VSFLFIHHFRPSVYLIAKWLPLGVLTTKHTWDVVADVATAEKLKMWGVSGADNVEIALVERPNARDFETFGDGGNGRVHEIDARIDIALKECSSPGKVAGFERNQMEFHGGKPPEKIHRQSVSTRTSEQIANFVYNGLG
jgi:hypothetical protein